MSPVHLFLLGLASGMALVALTSYRHLSPPWLKWLLIASGTLLISRYVMTAWWLDAGEAAAIVLYYVWVVSSIGLTLPGVCAIDQLIRHPAMTPKKLLRWYVLLPLADGIALFGMTLVPNHIWLVLVCVVHLVFFSGFVGVCVLLRRNISSPPIQRALLGLAFSYGFLGLNVFMATLGRWDERLFLYPEMLALLAIWYAYDTSARLQQAT